MLSDEELKRKLESLSSVEFIQFTKACYHNLFVSKYYFDNSETIPIRVSNKLVINISGAQMREYLNVYLERFSTKKEQKDYKKFSETLTLCDGIFSSTRNRSVQRGVLLAQHNLNISSDGLRRFAYMNCILNKGMSLQEARAQFSALNKIYVILDGLTDLEKDVDIVQYIVELKRTNSYLLFQLRNHMDSYVRYRYSDCSLDEQKEQLELLETKLVAYEDRNTYKDGYRTIEELNLLEEARSTILDFTSSENKIEEYCHLHNISVNKFQRYVSIVKKYDSRLSEAYFNRAKLYKSQGFQNNSEIYNAILYYLKNGIQMESSQSREFDVLDYYYMFKKPLGELLKYLSYEKKNITGKDYYLLRTFVAKGANQKPLDLYNVMNTDVEYNCSRDLRGFPIKGTGRILLESEKEYIIKFLRDNEIPLTGKTYYIAVKRYLDNPPDVKKDDPVKLLKLCNVKLANNS